MTETKFTPGPWSAPNKFWVLNAKGGCLARLALDDFDAVANAHLIAAAPDMYEALDVALRALARRHVYGPDVAKIRAARAKARGES